LGHEGENIRTGPERVRRRGMHMKLPLQVTFRNLKTPAIVEEWIAEEAAKLELFYDRLMGCKVAVEIPHRHHRKQEVFHIRIDLTLPGKEIVIKRQANLRNRATREGEARFTKQDRKSVV
jgi:hypothetical protein